MENREYSGLNMVSMIKNGTGINALRNPWGKKKEQKKSPEQKDPIFFLSTV